MILINIIKIIIKVDIINAIVLIDIYNFGKYKKDLNK